MTQKSDTEKKEQSKVVFCKVHTSDDYNTLCRILSTDRWIYRGHENSEWYLRTSLERVIEERETFFRKLHKSLDELAQNENDATISLEARNNFLNKYSNITNVILNKSVDFLKDMYLQEYNAIRSYMSKTHQLNLSNIEALCNLQHYGGKTRLLDFTFSMNIALYMALENKNKFQDRCIWAINYRKLNEILENLIKEYFINDKTTEKEFKTKFNMEGYFQHKIYNEFVQKCFYNEDLKETLLNKDLVIPIVIPDQNPRITAQNGLFLFPTSFTPFSECLCDTLGLKIEKDEFDIKNSKYPELYIEDIDNQILEGYKDFEKNERTIIDSKIIKIILSPFFEVDGNRILTASNITPYAIYPDFDGIAKSIVYW